MRKFWLPGDPIRPVYNIRNWGDQWARNVPVSFGNSGRGQGSGGGGQALAAPTNLSASAVSSSQINLTWTDNATADGGYKVEHSLDQSTWTQVGTTAANATSYSDTGLTGSTQYFYRVRAFKGGRNGPYSGLANATTTAAGPPATNLSGWWKASVGTFQTVDGTPATADGDPVGEWEDQSGNARHLLQATADSRPTLQTNEIDGEPCLRFDGSNDSTKALFTLNLPFQIFIVVKQISWVDGRKILASATGSNWTIRQNGSSPNIRQEEGGGNDTTNNNGLAVGSWGVLECNMPANGGGNQNIRVNQGAASSGSGNTNGNRNGILVGNGAALNVPSNIDVAEILYYSVAQTGADLTAVYTYLESEYPSLP